MLFIVRPIINAYYTNIIPGTIRYLILNQINHIYTMFQIFVACAFETIRSDGSEVAWIVK